MELKMTMATTSATSGPSSGSRRRLPTLSRLDTDGFAVDGAVAGAPVAMELTQPQQFCSPHAVSFDSIPGKGLSVTSIEPVSLKPLGLVPSFANWTTACTPISAIFAGNCSTVPPIFPDLTSAMPVQLPSIDPMVIWAARLADEIAWYAP